MKYIFMTLAFLIILTGQGLCQDDMSEQSTVIGGGSTSGVPQTLLPDISVTGTLVGKASNDKSDPNRNEVILEELELAFQGYLYPQIRGDAFIALANDEGHTASLEEGYISFLQLGNADLSLRLGKKRMDFGKINKTHPHHWLFVDAPLVNRNFLSEEGLITQGAFFSYLLPEIGQLFSSLDFGISQTTQHEEEVDGESTDSFGSGFESRVYSGRLWTSKAMSDISELEIGASVVGGPGIQEEIGELSMPNSVRIYGLDATYKKWPSAHQRLLVQGEAMRYSRAGNSSYGYYLFGNYRSDAYWDYGFRYDYSERAYPDQGHDSRLSAIITNRLTETTLVRLQLSHGDRAGFGAENEAFLQIIWGIGPHSHPLE